VLPLRPEMPGPPDARECRVISRTLQLAIPKPRGPSQRRSSGACTHPLGYLAMHQHTNFPAECVPRRTVFRGGLIAFTAERQDELLKVNAQINGSIVPKRNTEGLAGKGWLLSPKTGDCADYAVSKRHELLVRGWPSRALLLAEVVTTWGERHLVLVVRTRQGDIVADNLSQDLKPWTRTGYRWIRIQSPEAPSFWSNLAPT
jgi:predicted transglutaminase-like cysteine proteinase